MKTCRLIISSMLFVVLCFCAMAEAAPNKALIVSGQNNHNWQISMPILKQILEQTGLFDVDLAISPGKGTDMSNYKPSFSDYNLIVLDYNGDAWPKETQDAFVSYVKSGGGVIVYHAADNAFVDWEEYNKITGLGGWGGRNEKSGPYIRWKDGKIVRDTSPGKGGSHGARQAYQVVIRDKEHPITKGLPEKWMHAEDELYDRLRGPAENLTVLATAYSSPDNKGTGENEPILFTIGYGKGRIFHTALGHATEPLNPAMQCVGFIVTFQRGAEWAATGKVTQEIPADFPAATEVKIWKGYRPTPDLQNLLSKIAAYDYGQDRTALSEVDQYLRITGDSADENKKTEMAFIEFLKSGATPAGKQFICRKLSLIASEDSVEVLSGMLINEDTSDMARYALERIPGAKVDNALIEALGKTSGKVRVGVINTLGMRGDENAVDALSGLVHESDTDTVSAVFAAMGRIGSEKAAGILYAAKEHAQSNIRIEVLDAYLKCADRMVAAGQKEKAMKIYKELYVPDEPKGIRAAALKGLIGGFGADDIINIFKGDDVAAIQIAAAELISDGSDAGKARLHKVVTVLSDFSAPAQVQIINTLSKSKDGDFALPYVVISAKSEEADVRVAALNALGTIGDAAVVKILAESSGNASGLEKQTAQQSLARVSGAGVDEAIIQLIPVSAPNVKVELIRIIGERRITSAASAVMATTQDDDKQVRLESYKTLKVIAEPTYLPALADLLVLIKDQAELDEAEKTVTALSQKIAEENRRAEAVLKKIALEKEPSAKCSLMRVLGKIQADSALDVLTAGLEDKNEEVRSTCIRALADWPNSKPADKLLAAAKNSKNKIHSILALRGYINMAGLTVNESPEKAVNMYKTAMSMATRIDEKKTILSGVSKVSNPDALDFAVGYLEDAELKEEARLASLAIAMAIRPTNKDKADHAMSKIQKIFGSVEIKVEKGAETIISVNLGVLKSPMQFETGNDGMLFMAVSNSKDELKADPGQGGQAVFRFVTSKKGKLALGFHINCPNIDNDSWHIKLDSNEFVTWNDNVTRGWEWRQLPQEYEIDKGEHVLLINQREDGAKMSEIKFVLK